MIRISFLAALAAAAVLAGCGGSSEQRQKSGGPVEITMWHGQDDIAGKVLGQLADDFNKTHKNIHVKATTGGVVADQMRQKVTTALASGAYPDIAYIFGSDLANLARSDKVLDLTDDVKKPDFGWDDYYAPAKAATTVNGRVRALPALIDDLAVVYNKKLFKEMGVSEPPAGGWTWDQFIATSKQLTDKGKGTFGTAWPAVGDEDTVWRTWPLVWQAGGDIIRGRQGRVRRRARRAGVRRGRPARAGRLGLRRHQARLRPDLPAVQQRQDRDGRHRPVAAAGLPRREDGFGVAPLPAFGSEP